MSLNPRGTYPHARNRWLALGFCALFAFTLFAAPGAHAADRIYWANFDGPSISWTDLDGNAAGNLNTAGAPLDGPMGMAIDSAQGRIYWANYGEFPNGCGDGCGTAISWANLDGSGGGQFMTTGTVAGPHGLAIDPATQKIYWPNDNPPNQIAYSNLDGSGGGVLNTGSATVVSPRGLAIDPASNRIYWANHDGNKISYANLDGSGGGDIATGSAMVNMPEGVAVDPAAKKIYWGNFTSGSEVISWASLDGSGSGNLDTRGASPDSPHGVALDLGAGRIYWPNYLGQTISYAKLDGSGGDVVPTPGVTPKGPALPVLLKAPKGDKAPRVLGNAGPGSTLQCGPGTFAPDELSALLYRAPQSISYRWQKGKRSLADATGSVTAKGIGEYRCLQVGENVAGSDSQSSPAFAVFSVHEAKLDKRSGTAVLRVKVPDPGKLSLHGKGVDKQKTRLRKRKHRSSELTLKLHGKLRRELAAKGVLNVKVGVTYKPKGAPRDAQTKTLKLKKAG